VQPCFLRCCNIPPENRVLALPGPRGARSVARRWAGEGQGCRKCGTAGTMFPDK